MKNIRNIVFFIIVLFSVQSGGDNKKPTDKEKPILKTKHVSKRRGLAEILTTLFNVHTKEALPVFSKRLPSSDALNKFFRCRGFGEDGKLNPKLLKVVLEAAKNFESKRVEIISAYRSDKFNDTLLKKGRHVSINSHHVKGEAIDFRLNSTDAVTLGKYLYENFDGGVGTYKEDNFVHFDVGPKRHWHGK